MKKAGRESRRGGARPGAGRPAGQTKSKVSVSVDSDILEKALTKWGGKVSPLMEKLLRSYVE
jgi:uncharacterized protein (DUF4415 family)